MANNTCNGTLVCQNNICIDASEAGTMDSGTGVKDTGVKDTGKLDTGTDTGNGLCGPGDVSSFTPPTFHPPNQIQNVCGDTDIATYFKDCVDMYDQTKCAAFVNAKMQCADCLETLDMKDANWAASVDRGPYIFLNLSGCVKLQGDTACATALQAMDACEDAACLAACWDQSGMDQSDADALDACWTAADKGGCKKYVDAVNTACSADGGAAFNLCKVTNFAASYTPYAKLFCQGGG